MRTVLALLLCSTVLAGAEPKTPLERLAETAVARLDEYAKKYRTDTLWFDTLKVSADSEPAPAWWTP